MKILDLGCGNKKFPGAVGIDINPLSDADVINALNDFLRPEKIENMAGNQIWGKFSGVLVMKIIISVACN